MVYCKTAVKVSDDGKGKVKVNVDLYSTLLWTHL